MFDDEIVALIQKHRSRGVVVDTNLLLVYLIGVCDPFLLTKFKRTQQFDHSDFHVLQVFLANFTAVISTPGILTEVNSLANQLQSRQKPLFFEVFKSQIALLDEKHVSSRELSQHEHFDKTGLTDASIMSIAAEDLLVLTDDFGLTGYLKGLDIDFVNYNHIRPLEG